MGCKLCKGRLEGCISLRKIRYWARYTVLGWDLGKMSVKMRVRSMTKPWLARTVHSGEYQAQCQLVGASQSACGRSLVRSRGATGARKPTPEYWTAPWLGPITGFLLRTRRGSWSWVFPILLQEGWCTEWSAQCRKGTPCRNCVVQ